MFRMFSDQQMFHLIKKCSICLLINKHQLRLFSDQQMFHLFSDQQMYHLDHQKKSPHTNHNCYKCNKSSANGSQFQKYSRFSPRLFPAYNNILSAVYTYTI